mgnify:CR=1 FL=1
MENETTQMPIGREEQNTEMSADEAMADLAFATNLQDQIMPQVAQEEGQMMPQEGPEVPMEEEMPQPEEGIMEEMMQKMEKLEKTVADLKKQVKSGGGDEVEGLKKELQDLIDKEDE